MTDIEKAMSDIQQHIGILDMRLQRDPESCNDYFLSKIGSYSLAIQALEEKAERDKMRCENCKQYVNCEGGLCEREKLFEFPSFNKTDFCSRFTAKGKLIIEPWTDDA